MDGNDICVSAKRGEDGVYTIDFTEKGDYTVLNGNDLLEYSGLQLKISVPFPQERRVFVITGKDSKKIYVSEKHIPMRGTPNFRDLGGIANKHGKYVRWGKFFRSGTLSRLTETDLGYFKTLGIKTVVDFRSGAEVEQEPDKFPDNYEVKYVKSPIGNPADFEKLIEFYEKKQDAQHAVKSVMLKGAEAFAGIIHDFQPLIDSMLEGDPFLFHCSAGKDRTGFAAALILSVLDVDREIILDDYLLSNKYTIPYFTKYISVITDMGIPENIALAAAGVRKEFLETTLDSIDKKYGNFDNMLSEVFDIDAKKKKELIEKYTIQ